MKRKLVFSLCTILALLAALFAAPSHVSADSNTLLPVSYTTTSGASGGQPVTNLHVQDQSGSQNDWDKYVEFNTPSAAYAGYRSYTVPTAISIGSITAIQVKANYLGPAPAQQTWTWSIYNWSTSAWVTLGTNVGASWSSWKLFTFNASGTFANYVKSDTRQIRIRLQSNNAADDADLDYEAVLLTYTSGQTATLTNSPTPTNTPIGPTNTFTNTPVTPTNTFTNTPVTPTSTASITSYEAEASNNTLAGGAAVEGCSTCSGGNLVAWVGNNAGTLQFNGINAAATGNYTATIYYINGDATSRSATISVNGSAGTSLSFASTGSWTVVGTLQTTVTLNAGASNTIKFSNPVTGSWAPDFDRLTINAGAGPTFTPTNTATRTPTSTPTRTNTPTPTRTNTPLGPTNTFTTTATFTNTPASGTCTHFVATTGNDSNTGTSIGSPWRTIQKAANTVGAGSTVCVRGGTYVERVNFSVSGASGQYTTFQSYTGETPIVDGTGLSVPAGNTAMFMITNQSYLKIQGFEIRNYKTSTTNNVPVGLRIVGTAHHVEIRNNKIHHIEHNGTAMNGTDAHGLSVHGTSGTQSVNNIIIDGNELYSLKLGSSEALVLNGNVEFWQVTNNIVRDSNNIGIDIIGFEGTAPSNDRARDGLVAYNDVYNLTSAGNVAYGSDRSAGCIYVDGGTRITIEYNKAHNCNLGVEIASEHQGTATSFVTVRNNFIYNNTDVGLGMGGYDDERGSTENCLIVNNTFYNNAAASDTWGSELYIQYDTRNNIIKNNIFHAKSGMPYILSWSPVMTNNVMNYNLFYGGTTWQWRNVNYTTFSAYQSGTGNDANSLNNVNPSFVNAASGDLHLQAGSPAINAGQTISEAGSLDIDGQARVQGPSIEMGADEKQ